MARQEISEILGPGDRGELTYKFRNEGSDYPLSKADLYRIRLDAIALLRFSGFAENLSAAITGLETRRPLTTVVDQLSGIEFLHSIRFPARGEVIDVLSQSTNRAVGVPRQSLQSDRPLDRELKISGGQIVAQALLASQLQLLREGMEPHEVLLRTGRVLTSFRNLSMLDDNILRQALLDMQTDDTEVSLTGMADVLDTAGKLLIEETRNYPEIGGEIVKSLVQPTVKILNDVRSFVSTAEQTRLKREIESEEEATIRAIGLVYTMSQVADEYLVKQGDDNKYISRRVGITLIEGLFAHRVHWIGERRSVITALCRALVDSKHTDAAAETLLYAQQAKLIKPHEVVHEELYEEAGLEQKLIRDHRKIILEGHKKNRAFIHPSQLKTNAGATKTFLLGYYNVPHIAHRNLAFGGYLTLASPHNEETELVIVSINQNDPNREAGSTENGTILLDFNERKPLVGTNLAGLIGNGVVATSIDLATSPNIVPPERITEFLKDRGIRGARVCGFDRKDLTPDTVDPIILGLRSSALRKITQDRGILDDLETQFPEKNIVFLLQQRTNNISATATVGLARSWLTTRDTNAYDQLRSYLHPENVDRVIKLVSERMS